MPEGDMIFRAARTLHKALAGEVVTAFETVLPKLARVEVDRGVVGRTVEKVEAHGKWMKMYFSGDLILLTHMLMSGSWHIYRPGQSWQKRAIHQRITIGTQKIIAVAFNVPVAEFHTATSLIRRLRQIGPSLLAEEFDERKILQNLRAQSGVEVGPALLNQSVAAGIGNIFKSEVCFSCGVNPFRLVDTLTIQEAACLIATARKFLLENVRKGSGDRITTFHGIRRPGETPDYEQTLWVYGRGRLGCRRCDTPIESRKQTPGARITFWCPRCQPMTVATIGWATAGRG